MNEAEAVTFQNNFAGFDLKLPGVLIVQQFFGMDVTSYTRDVLVLVCESIVLIGVVIVLGSRVIRQKKELC